MKLLKQLPTDIVLLIFEYDSTYRIFFTTTVLPSLLAYIRDLNYCKLVAFENNFPALNDLLLKHDFPFWLFVYNDKFHQIDTKYFNHFFRRILNGQRLYLNLYH